MRLSLADLSELRALVAARVDAIIDVRAPHEYAEDHLPGAINLPVLSDAERAQVGTVYVQQSRFEARRLGAALVARNAARHLEGPLAECPPRWRPLVYCWRGGQRSGAFATILQQVGWPVRVLDGGYRGYRRLVVRAMYEAPFPAPVVVLDGDTGSAKTAVIARLAVHGVQALDLEAMARHRGSLFGAEAGPQPAQKGFESALAAGMGALDPARPVVVEAESNRIGEVLLPPALWQAMQAAPRVVIDAPRPERAAYLARDYAHLGADPDALATRIAALSPWHARAQIDAWQGLARAGALPELANALLEHHYDPRYRRSRAQRPAPLAVLETPALDASALDALAKRLAGLLGASKIDAPHPRR